MADGETTTADPMDRVADALTSLGENLGTQVSEAVSAVNEANNEAMRAFLDDRFPAEPDVDDIVPGAAEGDELPLRLARAEDTMTDPYSSWWTDTRLSPEANQRAIRSNFEMVMLMSTAARGWTKPAELSFDDEFLNAARAHIFEHRTIPKPRVYTGGDKGDYAARNFRDLDVARAMDSQESGFGADLVDVQYATEMWEAARNRDTLVNDIETIPMSSATEVIPIDGGVPEMFLVAEKTAAGAELYPTSKTPSSSRTLTSKLFTIQQDWSAILQEDSVIAWVPFLRKMLGESAALHLGSAYLNGDTTNAGTGNINLDDADPAETKHYLAWDGIRHYWLVDDTGQGIAEESSLDPDNIGVIRGRLNGDDGDLNSAVGNINWGRNPRDLRLMMDWDTHLDLMKNDKVTTVDKYGMNATVLTGELGSYEGIPIISPPYYVKTESDGKQSTTVANNTKGQITLFAPEGYKAGLRRETQLFFDRIQGQDQFKFELYTRRAFQRHGSNVAAGIYDILL